MVYQELGAPHNPSVGRAEPAGLPATVLDVTDESGPPRGVWQRTTIASGVTVAYRLTDAGDRLVVTDLYLRRPEGLAARDVANVPVRRLEGLTDADERAVRDGLDEVPDERANLDLLLDVLLGGGRRFTTGTATARASASAETTRPPEPLGRPRGGDPEFYRRVAQRYRVLAMEGHNPTTRLAQEAGVPLSTAQRWLREARRNNFLAAGRPGVQG